MNFEEEIEALKKRVKLLEEFRDLKQKVEELEKQIGKPSIPYIPYPIYPSPWQPYNPYPWWCSDSSSSNTYLGGNIYET